MEDCLHLAISPELPGRIPGPSAAGQSSFLRNVWNSWNLGDQEPATWLCQGQREMMHWQPFLNPLLGFSAFSRIQHHWQLSWSVLDFHWGQSSPQSWSQTILRLSHFLVSLGMRRAEKHSFASQQRSIYYGGFRFLRSKIAFASPVFRGDGI